MKGLTHLIPLVYFGTLPPLKISKNLWFFMFSGIERDQWYKMGSGDRNPLSTTAVITKSFAIKIYVPWTFVDISKLK